jgi:hypothetical protein
LIRIDPHLTPERCWRECDIGDQFQPVLISFTTK